MPKLIMLPTFDEFRVSHREVLRRHRERLREEAVAEEILREGQASLGEWIPWGDANLYATQS